MSYEKHTWVNNEVITPQKMNAIESGISGSKRIIIFSGTTEGGNATINTDFYDIEDDLNNNGCDIQFRYLFEYPNNDEKILFYLTPHYIYTDNNGYLELNAIFASYNSFEDEDLEVWCYFDDDTIDIYYSGY